MSGIYIPGMGMPQRDEVITIYPDGIAHLNHLGLRLHISESKAVPVPEHEQILRVLKTERECVSWDCDRNCGKCELALEQSEILDVYDVLLAMFSPADKEGEG